MKSTDIARTGLAGTLLALAAGTAWAVFQVPSVERHGHDPQLRAGHAVAVGDINNDGVPDLVVGAPAFEAGQAPEEPNQNADSAGPDGPEGEVLIYLGTGTGIEDPLFLTLHGEAPNDGFGTALKIGDVTGDGINDLVVSAMYASGLDGPPRSGCVYIFEGPLAPPQIGEEIHAAAEVCGTQHREHFGRSLEVGEFDATAGSDIAVGAPWYSAPHGHDANSHPSEGYLTGAVYLISGHEIAEHLLDPAHEIHAPRTPGDGWLAHYGESLLNVGNLDQETTPAPQQEELLIFAPGANNSGHGGRGRAYLATWDKTIHTGETAPAGFEDAHIVMEGPSGSALGSGTPALVGNLDSSPAQEIAIPVRRVSSTVDPLTAGGLYIIPGDLMSLAPYNPALTDPATHTNPTVHKVATIARVSITGERSQDRFGQSIVALGDVNSDAVPDFAVGAPWADGLLGGANRALISGGVYVLSGAAVTPGTSKDLKLADLRTTGAVLDEPVTNSNDRLGQALAAGELIGAGPMELIIGVPDADAEGNVAFGVTDAPGLQSNDNRGAVLIRSYTP